MSTGKGLATFQRIIVPSPSGSSFCTWRRYYCSNCRYLCTSRQDVISQNTWIFSGPIVRASSLAVNYSFIAFFKIHELFRSELSVVPFGAVFLLLCYTLAMSVPQIQMPHSQCGVLRTPSRWQVTSLGWMLEFHGPPQVGRRRQCTEFSLTDFADAL